MAAPPRHQSLHCGSPVQADANPARCRHRDRAGGCGAISAYPTRLMRLTAPLRRLPLSIVAEPTEVHGRERLRLTDRKSGERVVRSLLQAELPVVSRLPRQRCSPRVERREADLVKEASLPLHDGRPPRHGGRTSIARASQAGASSAAVEPAWFSVRSGFRSRWSDQRPTLPPGAAERPTLRGSPR